ncbi:hypothetical protein F5888DRAFT_330351 [Russula emetica]|nr:hypothetical protein F5888DRAFT_330351 [Russula emetica]
MTRASHGAALALPVVIRGLQRICPFTAHPSHHPSLIMSSSDLPLPYGWVQEFDPKTNHPFWVNTNAEPPRAIWTHPYNDEQYLREHPEVREKIESRDMKQQNSKYSPPSMPPGRRHSFHGNDSATMVLENDEATQDSSNRGIGNRGFFGNPMGRTIGTQEEREAYRRQEARLEMERERQNAEMINAQRARYAQEQALYDQRYRAGPSYGPPLGDPYMYGYGPEYGRGYGYGYDDYPGDFRRDRDRDRDRCDFGGDGLGGVAEGLLLADIL